MDEIALKLSPNEISIILHCLAEQPYKITAGVIGKIQEQSVAKEVKE